MIVSHDREKLVNAVVYFVRETKYCHTLKLFKLLNVLDFEHFRQRGRTVTGLNYEAWENGPVPPELFREIDKGGEADLRAAVTINDVKDEITQGLKRRDFIARVKFDPTIFTGRELKIMERIAEIFRDARGETMRDFSHLKGLPWKAVYKSGEGNGKNISPELSLDAEALMSDRPTIDRDELKFRREFLRDSV